MEQNKTSAKDFFMHLGAVVALYAVVGSFLNLLFSVINKAFPETTSYGYYYFASGASEISFAVATLIVMFPIFLILSWMNHRSYEINPEKKLLSVRKWLTYITLFVAGAVLAGDLVTVLYKFLDGQDISTAFTLKALSVLLVAGLVFGFYLQDIKDRISKKQEKVWASVVGLIIVVAIILGFSVMGSPRTQRLLRQDDMVVADLQNMQWQVINYWQINGSIPESWSNMMAETQSGKSYEYKKTGELSFQLCAEFNIENMMQGNGSMMGGPYYKGGIMPNDNWDHPMGRHCFSRTIDPIAYPTQVRG